jgi:hypothetical protein
LSDDWQVAGRYNFLLDYFTPFTPIYVFKIINAPSSFILYLRVSDAHTGTSQNTLNFTEVLIQAFTDAASVDVPYATVTPTHQSQHMQSP